MNTTIINNGIFTVRKREYTLKTGSNVIRITAKKQHSDTYNQSVRFWLNLNNSCTSIGNLTKKSVRNYIKAWTK